MSHTPKSHQCSEESCPDFCAWICMDCVADTSNGDSHVVLCDFHKLTGEACTGIADPVAALQGAREALRLYKSAVRTYCMKIDDATAQERADITSDLLNADMLGRSALAGLGGK